MNQYVNTVTGAYIRTECEISGDNWKKIETPAKKAPKEEAPKKVTKRVRK